MATRYWVGGSGTWDASTTTNWSATSGGVGGASAPTSADDVVFDTLSSLVGYTITVGTNAACNSITVSAPASGVAAFSLAATSILGVYGSMLLNTSSSTWTGASGARIDFRATTTGKTITTNGIGLISVGSNNQIVFNGLGGEWTLSGAISAPTIVVSAGIFRSGNFNITCATNFVCSGASVRAVYLGSATLIVAGTFQAGTNNLTFDAGTSLINMTNTSAPFTGSTQTYYNVSFTSTGPGTSSITGDNTFTNLTIATITSADGVKNITIGGNQTITGTLTFGTVNTAVKRLNIYSDIVGTPRTFTVATLATLSDCNFRDITAAGAAGTWTGTRLGNGLGNTNITFATPKSVYWNLAAGGNWSAVAWATSSGGTPDVNNFPLPQDMAIIENTGLNTSATLTLNSRWWVGGISFSTRSNAVTLTITTTANVVFFDGFVLSSAVTLTGTTAGFEFGAQGVTKQITSAGQTYTQAIVVNNGSGTLQLADALATSGAFTLTSGTLDLNGFDLTALNLASDNSNVRSIAFGANKIVVSGTPSSTPVAMATMTNFSYTGSGQITSTYNGATTMFFYFGNTAGVTESNALNLNVTAATGIAQLIAGSRIKNIDFTGFTGSFANTNPVIYGNVTFSSGMTITAGSTAVTFGATSGTQAITANGKTLDFPITKNGAGTLQLADALTIGATRTFALTAGTLDLNGFDLSCGVFSSSNSNTRSIAFGTNKIIVVSTATGGNPVLTFAISTNFTFTGTPVFDFVASSGTQRANISNTETNAITLTKSTGMGTLEVAPSVSNQVVRDINVLTGALLLSNTNLAVCGNFSVAAGVTVSGLYTVTFNAVNGTQVITTNGITMDFPISKAGGSTLRLADALTMGATRTLAHTEGAIDLNGKTLTVGAFSSTGAVTRSIAFNGGSIVDLGAWTASGSNFTTSGVGTISMTSASAKTFAGGGFSYPTLNQGGAGALSITGANSFADMTNTVQPATVTLPSSTITNVAAFSLAGTVGNLITLNSSSAGARATLNKTTGGALTRSYLSIQDSAATPAQVWFAGSTSTNVSNNTGWIFADLAITTETTTLTDTTDTTGIFVADIIESEALTDAYTTQVDFAGTQNETITLTDTPSSLAVYVASQTDTQTLSDSSVGNATYPNTVTDTMTVSDSMQGLLIYDLQITETTTLTEAQSAVFFFSGAVAELMFLDASQASLAIYNSAINEPIHITDRQASFGWFPVDTTQNAGWVDINNTQV